MPTVRIRSVAGEKDWNCSLKHPEQWMGHPCTQTTARIPGPFTSDFGRKPARLSMLIGRHPGSLFSSTIILPPFCGLAKTMPVLGTDLSGKYYPDMPGIAVHPRGRAFKHTYRIRSDYTNSILPLLNALFCRFQVFLLYFLWITNRPVHAWPALFSDFHAPL